MLLSEKIRIRVNNQTLRWYREKGYKIPTHTVQLWANVDGKRVKNGKETRVASGTEIDVFVRDLPPSSNVNIDLVCSDCSRAYTTTFGAYKRKHTDKCKACQKKETKNGGCHSYWVNKLITNNEHAKCDISGERDKRFLVLHHLNGRGERGENSEENYVILSANYHMAFHVSVGGTNVKCTKEQYEEFKRKEIDYMKTQTDVLAEDWEIVQ